MTLHPMATTHYSLLIQKRSNLFKTFGIPRKIVGDSDRYLVSPETEQFFGNNSNRYVKSAPCNRAPNGQADRRVDESKQSIAKVKSGSLSCHLAQFLLVHQTTMSVNMGKTSAMLRFYRVLSSVITRLQQPTSERDGTMSQPAIPHKSVTVDEHVLNRKFRGALLRIPGTVTNSLGYDFNIVKTNQNTVSHGVCMHSEPLRDLIHYFE